MTTLGKEGFASGPKRAVPFVSLATFLIYFSHWLQFYYYYKLLSFIYPFRFVEKAYLKDAIMDAGLFTVASSAIDEEAVIWELQDTVSAYPAITATDQVVVIPGTLAYPLRQFPKDLGLTRPIEVNKVLLGLGDL